MADSGLATVTYTILRPQDASTMPRADVVAGTYTSSQVVTLTTTLSGGEIYYTQDGSTPSTSSEKYTAPIFVMAGSRTIKAITVKQGYSNSDVASFTYTIIGAVAAPTFSVAAGVSNLSQSVTLATTTPGAAIYYTVDGTTPTTASTLYSGVFMVSSTATVKAFGVKTNYADSSVASAEYTINILTAGLVEAFPDTSAYPSVRWTPRVKFSIAAGDTLGLFSDTAGTTINTPTAISAGSNIMLADTVSTLGVTNAVYAKSSVATQYADMGSYTTKLPMSFSIGGISGAANVIVKDAVSTGCTTLPNCLIIGGTFTAAGGIAANNIVKIKPDGSFVAFGSGITGAQPMVMALALDGSGNVYAGGYFSKAGGVSANNIAKWDVSASTWSVLGSGTDETINSMVLDGSRNLLYAGGFFQNAGGVNVNYIAKWDVSASTWSALGTEIDSAVNALVLDGSGNLYVGGEFSSPHCERICKWDVSASTWFALGQGTDQAIHALVLDGSGNLYAGGFFYNAGGTTVNHIAKWDVSASTWSALGSGINEELYISFPEQVGTLAVDGSGNLYAGGDFSSVGGVGARYIAKWDASTSTWSALGTGIDSPVSALAFDGSGKLYAGGGFLGANAIAKWDVATSTWSALFDGMSGGGVIALALDGLGNLYAGGNFSTPDGSGRNIAKWDVSASTWSTLGSGTDATITALALDSSGNLYVGGYASTADPWVSASYIAKWNGSGWSNLGSGITGFSVNALVVDGSGNLYAGGNFSAAGGAAVNNIAKWDVATSTWSVLGTGINSTVDALAFDTSGNLYAGGYFSTAGGVSAHGIAKWNVATSTWSALGAGIRGGSVLALAFDSSGNLYAGGNFSTPDGNSRDIAKWDVSTSTWSNLGSGTDSQVNSLAFDGSGNLYAGGDFSSAAGVAASHIAKWDMLTSTWSPLGSGTNGGVNDLAFDGSGNLYAVGAFSIAGGLVRPYIAKWVTPFSSWF